MSKKVAIVQSNYIPWKGYFDMIAAVDEFILYDDMQYTRRDWRNRNQIKTPQGVQWLTVPVKVKGRYDQIIRDTEIDGRKWPLDHWKALEQNYRRAAHFADVASSLRPLYVETPHTHLSLLNRSLIEWVCARLGVRTRLSWSWDYALEGERSARLASLCAQAGASEYVSGPAARDYLDFEPFRRRGIQVTWFDYSGYPEYPQLWGTFQHGVTILDMLFNCGGEAGRYMKYVRACPALDDPAACNRMPDFLNRVARYYAGKLARHGDTPQGVDWNGAESQRIRFEQLLKIVDADAAMSINDVGCGYGALVDYLDARGAPFSYGGYDVSEEMVSAARARFAGRDDVSFAVGSAPQTADYCVASGIFNVRLDASEQQWREHVLHVLDTLNAASRRGFAFNCLTTYSDAERMRPDLFYADPCWLFDHCKRHHSRHVALLHDYGLYEFTILVRKDA